MGFRGDSPDKMHRKVRDGSGAHLAMDLFEIYRSNGVIGVDF